MKTYHTASSQEGLRLPHSGILLGHLAEALRVKDAIAVATNERRARRYFAGERIEPQAVRAIQRALIDAVVPAEIQLDAQLASGRRLQDLLAAQLERYMYVWDSVVTEVNQNCYPVSAPEHLPVPALRLVLLDIGVRLGAWVGLEELAGVAPGSDLLYLERQPFAALVVQLQTRLGLSVEDLAGRSGVSPQTVSGWRSGQNPTGVHLEVLAKVLRRPEGDSVGRTEFRLRRFAALQFVRQRLEQICGEDRIADMVEGVVLTAKWTYGLAIEGAGRDGPASLDLHDLIAARRQEQEHPMQLRRVLWPLLAYGSSSPLGKLFCKGLSEVAKFRTEVAADFLALAGNWPIRISYWLREFGAHPARTAYVRDMAKEEFPELAKDTDLISGFLLEDQLRMANFDWHPEPDQKWFVVSGPPIGKAMNRAVQATQAASVGNFPEAIDHMRHAVKHQPQDAGLHFRLGAFLGHSARGRNEMYQEALLECRLAVQLDPDFGNARNEIGIVLSNMRQHEEAEQAFAEAEPYYGDHAHHWFTRGINYLALKQFDQAQAAFERAIVREKGQQHVQAMALLAATLMQLDRLGEARRLGKKVHHLTGRDPTEDWESTLDIWGDNRE